MPPTTTTSQLYLYLLLLLSCGGLGASSCPKSGFSCQSHCQPAQEVDFKCTAMSELKQHLKESSQETSQLLLSYSREFQTLSFDLLQVAKTRSLSKLSSDQRIYEATRALFEAMSAHLRGQQSEASLDFGQNITRYFRQLYRIHRIPEDSAAEEQLQVSQAIKNSLEFARTLLQSLAMSHEMFVSLAEKADQWMPQTACHHALARMSVCQQCQRVSQVVAPCENYCLNVLRGCMNDVFELNRFWSDHVKALELFKNNFLHENNIENVMSNLEEKLIRFMANLNERCANAHSINNMSSARQLLEPCPNGVGTPSLSLRSAEPSRFGGRPAGRLLPPTQHQPAEQFGQAARKARLSPAMSLFNRLEEMVFLLQETRDFFANWPRVLCNRIRASATNNPSFAAPINQAAAAAATNASSHKSPQECWNGYDFTGYNKPLVQFGQPITSNHPEVAMIQADPINALVLNYVARLRMVNSQLTLKSARSPNLLHYQSAAEAISRLQQQQQDYTIGRYDTAQKLVRPMNNEPASNRQSLLELGFSSLAPPPAGAIGVQVDPEEPEEAEESEGEDSNLSEVEAESEDERHDDLEPSDEPDESEPEVKCNKPDCSDLFDTSPSANLPGPPPVSGVEHLSVVVPIPEEPYERRPPSTNVIQPKPRPPPFRFPSPEAPPYSPSTPTSNKIHPSRPYLPLPHWDNHISSSAAQSNQHLSSHLFMSLMASALSTFIIIRLGCQSRELFLH